MALVPDRSARHPSPPVLRRAPWSARDDVLAWTCRLGATVANGGDLDAVPTVPTAFPPRPGERVWATGGFRLWEFRSLGDGSWSTTSTIVGGTGVVGVGLLAGSLFASSMAKDRAMRRAQDDAQPRWVPVRSGTLYVTSHGWYMVDPGHAPWSWESVTAATMVAPGAVQVTGTSATRPVAWVLESDWAELLFVLWALARHRQHPQLAAGGWLPDGWTAHAAAWGRPVPPSLLLR